MKTDSESLYSHYSNKSHNIDGIMARHKQRMNCLKRYKTDGSCKKKLQQFGILPTETGADK